MSESPPRPVPSFPPDVHPWVAEGHRRLRFGLGVVGRRADWAMYFDWAARAERLGFDSFWIQDHPINGIDCWTGLAALALRTTTLRLGSLVSCVYYRSPALLARVAADVDCLSGGRLVLGVGFGDAEAEFAKLGLPFPPTGERQRALEEAVQIVRGLWGPQPFAFAGRHFRTAAATVRPPVQLPRVPLLIAGGGERVTLRQVAQYADMCNFGPHVHTGAVRTAQDVRHRLDVLHRHCAAVGRPAAAVLASHITLPLVLAQTDAALQARLAALPAAALESTRQAGGLFAGTPEQALAYYRGLAAAGMQYFIVAVNEADHETAELLGTEVLPALTA